MRKKSDKTLIEFLNEHAESGAVSFHMPGHKGARFFEQYGYGDVIKNLVDHDVTEIYGADNLFIPKDVILDLMERYAALYDVRKTFLSVGGSSNGLIASILSVLEPGDSVLIARNSHKSIYNGVTLAGGKPVYVYPEILLEEDIAGEIKAEDVERILSEMNGVSTIKAVVIPSPNYYGILSDIKEISKVCHDYGAILIVDQAHGAHLNFMDSTKELAAERCGADIVINSIHKTLASFTQTAVVNVCTDMVDIDILGEKLEMIQSSSPSYILMESLGMNLDILENHAQEIMENWEKNLDWFYQEAEKISGLEVFYHCKLDPGKILLDMRRLGISGILLDKLLHEKGIFMELSDENFALAMTGVGNEREDYWRLIAALREITTSDVVGDIAEFDGNIGDESVISDEEFEIYFSLSEILRVERNRREVKRPFERVKLEDARGRVVASSVIPYPPGIPLLVPGDVLDERVIKWLKPLVLRGDKILGIDNNGCLLVTKE